MGLLSRRSIVIIVQSTLFDQLAKTEKAINHRRFRDNALCFAMSDHISIMDWGCKAVRT